MAIRRETYGEWGLKLTPQRLAILDYLDGNREHPSAEDVFRAVRRKYPTMSFATVYNTLETLIRHGRVKELTGDPDRKRFDPNTRPHNHIICTTCRKIVDVPVAYRISVDDRYRAGFKITGNNIEFTGVCKDCRKRSIT
jgi:Fur family transcriptional regulator, peroxide stress response regulator